MFATSSLQGRSTDDVARQWPSTPWAMGSGAPLGGGFGSQVGKVIPRDVPSVTRPLRAECPR